VYIQTGAQKHICTFGGELLAQRLTPGPSECSIPGGCHSQRGGEGRHLPDLLGIHCAVALAIVLEVQRRDALSGHWLRVAYEEPVRRVPNIVRIAGPPNQSLNLLPGQVVRQNTCLLGRLLQAHGFRRCAAKALEQRDVIANLTLTCLRAMRDAWQQQCA